MTLLSLQIACAATVIALLIAIPLAYRISRRPFVGRSILEALLTVPLVLPPTVVGYLLIASLGADSMIGRWLDYSIVFTIQGAILAASVVAFPLIYLPARAAFTAIDAELEDAARVMGASRLQLFWHVGLPLARRGIAGGVLLGFARALGEFGATVMVLGIQPKKLTLPISVYLDYEQGDLARAWPAVMVMLGVSLVVVTIHNRSSLGRRD